MTEIKKGGSYGAGWYTLSGTRNRSQITFTGDTHLILADKAEVTVSGGITLNGGSTSLTIYVQSTGGSMGRLTIDSVQEYCAGIGSNRNGTCGNITVNGGYITVNGVDAGAGNGGIITATGGNYGAGIGTGWNGRCGDITIKGDTVTASADKGQRGL